MVLSVSPMQLISYTCAYYILNVNCMAKYISFLVYLIWRLLAVSVYTTSALSALSALSAGN